MSETSQIRAEVFLTQGGFTLDVKVGLPLQGLTAILGRSGSGKTTFLRWIAGLQPSKKGFLKVGEDVWEESAQNYLRPTHQRAVGYVPQNACLLAHLNVQANLFYAQKRAMPSSSTRLELDQVVQLLGIGHLLNRSVSNLSGGEKSRVAIARALLVAPQVLLLDEPLSGMDDESKVEIMSYLSALKAKLEIPILYVTHSSAEVTRLADHSVRFQSGKLIEQDWSLNGLNSSMAAELDAKDRQICPTCLREGYSPLSSAEQLRPL